jgi:hypothetical protein
VAIGEQGIRCLRTANGEKVSASVPPALVEALRPYAVEMVEAFDGVGTDG